MASARDMLTPGQFALNYNAGGSAQITNYDPNNWTHKVGGFFTGDNARFDAEYEAYKDRYQQDLVRARQLEDYERAEKSEASARAFEEYMSNTAFQRAYQDLMKTGLNPRLLLESVSGASTPSAQGVGSVSSSQSWSQSQSSSKSESTSNSFSTSAIIAALIVAALKFLK